MNVTLKRDPRRRVSQYLAERFYFKSDLNASCREGVPQYMKMKIVYTAVFAVFFYVGLQNPRFNKFCFAPRQQKRVRRGVADFFFTQLKRRICQRNDPRGSVAFR